jgi:CubicO group peptidase (beta-lactamase class C family)
VAIFRLVIHTGIEPFSAQLIHYVVAAFLLIGNSTLALAQAASVGKELPGLEAFDQAISGVLQQWPDVPGASLAVAKNGKLLLVKGFGMADREKRIPITPDTLFRMGSINKTITSVAILRLVEDGKLQLDDPVLPLLERAGIVPSKLGTASAANITVRNLLQHSGGMDRDKSGDPFFARRLVDVSKRQNVAPVTCNAIAKDTLEQPLDFEPGSKYSYSNAGYCILGDVVEVASGMTYQKYINQAVLRPAIGKDSLAGHSVEPLPNEVRYASLRNATAAPGISGGWLGVPEPYGAYSIEGMEALGAWVATPSDVLKFFLTIDGARGNRLLSENSIVDMQAKPLISGVQNTPTRYYGLGIEVLNTPIGNTWFHRGSQPGLTTSAVRASNGISWVIAFNGRPDDKSFPGQTDAAIWQAIRATKQWPQGDLFSGADAASSEEVQKN